MTRDRVNGSAGQADSLLVCQDGGCQGRAIVASPAHEHDPTQAWFQTPSKLVCKQRVMRLRYVSGVLWRIPELGKLLMGLEFILCTGRSDDPAAVLGLFDVRALVVVCCGDGLLRVRYIWRSDFVAIYQHISRSEFRDLRFEFAVVRGHRA